jgi:hypothetical protein
MLGFTRDIAYMVIVTLQQIIDERISFLKEQINPNNKPEVNSTFQLQIDAIRSINDFELIEPIISKKKAQLKIVKMCLSPTGCLQNLTAWNGCSDT